MNSLTTCNGRRPPELLTVDFVSFSEMAAKPENLTITHRPDDALPLLRKSEAGTSRDEGFRSSLGSSRLRWRQKIIEL